MVGEIGWRSDDSPAHIMTYPHGNHIFGDLLPKPDASIISALDNIGQTFIDRRAVGPTSAVNSATKYAVWAISDGLRQESKNIRVTIISLGVVETELGSDITDESSKGFLKELRKTALKPEALA
jgi:NAD(P)-dependent dehydrogenase (short-subunit alcohol dehydrogenase family)